MPQETELKRENMKKNNVNGSGIRLTNRNMAIVAGLSLCAVMGAGFAIGNGSMMANAEISSANDVVSTPTAEMSHDGDNTPSDPILSVSNEYPKTGDTITYSISQQVGTLGENLDARYSSFVLSNEYDEEKLDLSKSTATLYRVDADGDQTMLPNAGTFHAEDGVMSYELNEDTLRYMPLEGETYRLDYTAYVKDGVAEEEVEQEQKDETGASDADAKKQQSGTDKKAQSKPQAPVSIKTTAQSTVKTEGASEASSKQSAPTTVNATSEKPEVYASSDYGNNAVFNAANTTIKTDHSYVNTSETIKVTVTYALEESGDNLTLDYIDQSFTGASDGLVIQPDTMTAKIGDESVSGAKMDSNGRITLTGTELEAGSTLVLSYDIKCGEKNTDINGHEFRVLSTLHASTGWTGNDFVLETGDITISNPTLKASVQNSTGTPSAGDVVDQTITLSVNGGTGTTAYNPVMTITTADAEGAFPAGFEYTEVTSETGTVNFDATSGTITVTANELTSGSPVVVKAKLKVGDSTSVDLNNVTLKTSASAVSDTTPDYNASNANASLTVQEPKLSIKSSVIIPVDDTTVTDGPVADEGTESGDESGTDTPTVDSEQGTEGEGGEASKGEGVKLPDLSDLDTSNNVINAGDRATVLVDVNNENANATAKNLAYADKLDEASVEGGAYIDTDSIHVLLGETDITDKVTIETTDANDGCSGFSVTGTEDANIDMPRGSQHLYVMYDVIAGTTRSNKLRGVEIKTDPSVTCDNTTKTNMTHADATIVVASSALVTNLTSTKDEIAIDDTTTYTLTVQNRIDDEDSIARSVVIAGNIADSSYETGYTYVTDSMKVYKVSGKHAEDVTDSVKVTWTEGKQFVIETGEDLKAVTSAQIAADKGTASGDTTDGSTDVDTDAATDSTTDNGGAEATGEDTQTPAIDVDGIAQSLREGYIVTFDGTTENMPAESYSNTLSTSAVTSADNAAYSTAYNDILFTGREREDPPVPGNGSYSDDLVLTEGEGGAGGAAGGSLSQTGGLSETGTVVGIGAIGTALAGAFYALRKRILGK